MQYPYDPQHPEYHHTREEEYGDYGEKTHHAIKGNHEFYPGPDAPFFREQKIRRPQSQHILHAKEDRGNDLDDLEKPLIRTQLLKCLKDHHQDVQHDVGHQNVIEYDAWGIPLLSYLYYVKNFLFHDSVFASQRCFCNYTIAFIFYTSSEWSRLFCLREERPSKFLNNHA